MVQMGDEFNLSLAIMINKIRMILADNNPSIYLYGSVTTNDFKLGWSDIDILVLTTQEISEQQAEKLVDLRQKLLVQRPDNQYFRLFEGGMLSFNAFFNREKSRTVYWGTSGERITDHYELDSFGIMELLENGVLLYGADLRQHFTKLTYDQLHQAVIHHYETIRNHGKQGWGWLLDIARCIYTLKTGKIIAKTTAGDWALKSKICPVPDTLQKALQVRKEPLIYKEHPDYKNQSTTLEPEIQKFADVLEQAILGVDENATNL